LNKENPLNRKEIKIFNEKQQNQTKKSEFIRKKYLTGRKLEHPRKNS
jgi:hypothetical protein